MRLDKSKLDKLVSLMERWLESGGSNRNPGMLARISGVNSQTIRRVLQKENLPELETALCLLNVIASPVEALDVVDGHDGFLSFVKKISEIHGESDSASDSNVASAQLINRERFWTYMLALTIGVSKDRIEKLCGAHGVFEMETMIEQKLLVERSNGDYIPSVTQSSIVIENKDVYSRATGYISDVAMQHEDAQKLFMVYNVTETDFETIKAKVYSVYSECEKIARKSNGGVVMASSFVTTRVLKRNEK